MVHPELHWSLFRQWNKKVDKHVENTGQQEAPAPDTHGGATEAVSSTNIRARRTTAEECRNTGTATPAHQETTDITLDPHLERHRSPHRVTRRTSYATLCHQSSHSLPLATWPMHSVTRSQSSTVQRNEATYAPYDTCVTARTYTTPRTPLNISTALA